MDFGSVLVGDSTFGGSVLVTGDERPVINEGDEAPVGHGPEIRPIGSVGGCDGLQLVAQFDEPGKVAGGGERVSALQA